MINKLTSQFFLTLVLLLCIGILVPVRGNAQDCSTSLRDAQHRYESGDFQAVINLLTPCIKNNLNDDDTWRGYRLMAISYLLLDDPDSADICIQSMLSRNPLYIPNQAIDPEEFIKALGMYEYFPKFSIGLQLGILDPLVKLLSSNTLTQTYSTQSDYKTKIGSTIGTSFEYHFIPSLALSICGVLTPQNFSRTYQPVNGKSVTYSEFISSITIPLSAHFDLMQGEFKPFIEAGAFAQLLTSASGSFSFNANNETASSSKGVLPLSNINFLDRRKGTNYGFVIGGGIARSFTSPLSELRLTARYWNGLRDMTRPEVRFTNPIIFQTFYYVDDDIALHGFEITVSFVFHLSLAQYRTHE